MELTAPFGSSVSSYSGKHALVLDASDYKVIQVDAGRSSISSNLTRTKKHFEGETEVSGRVAERLREKFSASNNKKKTLLESLGLQSDDLISYSIEGLDGYGTLKLKTSTTRPYVLLDQLNLDDDAHIKYCLRNVDLEMEKKSNSFSTAFGNVSYSATKNAYRIEMDFVGRALNSDTQPDLETQREIIAHVCIPINKLATSLLEPGA